MKLPLYIRLTSEGFILEVRVQPGSRCETIIGEYQQRLKIALKALPVDGKANIALIEFLSEQFNIA